MIPEPPKPPPNAGIHYTAEWARTAKHGHSVPTDKMYAVCRAIAARDAWFEKWQSRVDALLGGTDLGARSTTANVGVNVARV